MSSLSRSCASAGSCGIERPSDSAASEIRTPSAAADRDDAQRVARGIDPARRGLRDVEQLLRRLRAHHAELREHRVRHRVVTRDGSGVRLRRFAPERAAADLHHHDRFARLPGRLQSGKEAVRFVDALGISGDHVGIGIFRHPADHVAERHVGLVAGGDANRRAHAAVARLGVKMRAVRAGLARDTDAAGAREAALEARREHAGRSRCGC